MPLLKNIVTVIIGLGVFIAIAALGWGGLGPFLAHPARVALVDITCLLGAASIFTRGNASPGEREDRSNRWVLIAFGVISLALAYVPAWSDRTGTWTLDGDAMRWSGVVLYAIGGGLRLWPVFVLGRRFSGLVAIQKDHQLVTGGPYAVIRHPSYLGLMVGSLGWALAFRSGPGVILVALLLWPLIARIRAEERLLASQFGPPYDAYRARTSRLIPGIY